MATPLLSDSFQIPGEWSLPDNPTRIISGELKYTPDRIELHLNESLHPLVGTVRGSDLPNKSYPVIHGTTTKGEAVTLFGSIQLGFSINFGSGGVKHPENLLIQWLVMGAHLPADFVFPQITFWIPALQVWLSQQTIEHSQTQNESNGRTYPNFRLLPVDKITTTIPVIDAELEWGYGWNSNIDLFSSISFQVSACITIRPKSAQIFDWYFEQQRKLGAMLAFLAGVPMSSNSIKAAIDDTKHTVSIYLSQHDAQYCSYRNTHNFFLTCTKIGDCFPTIVARWYELYPTFQAPCQLAISILGSTGLWTHVEFLSLMQALEGFHRVFFEGTYLTEENYEFVKKALSEAIPSDLPLDHKAALKSRIKYGNQIALRKRIDALVNMLSEPIRTVVIGGNGKVPPSWIDTRNYYTHWDEELRENVLDGIGMYRAIIRMRHLVRVLYLLKMGVSQEVIYSSVTNTCASSQELLGIVAQEKKESS